MSPGVSHAAEFLRTIKHSFGQWPRVYASAGSCQCLLLTPGLSCVNTIRKFITLLRGHGRRYAVLLVGLMVSRIPAQIYCVSGFVPLWRAPLEMQEIS